MKGLSQRLCFGVAALLTSCGADATIKTSMFTAQQLDTITSLETSTANFKSNSIPDEVFKIKNLRSLSIKGMECDYGEKEACWEIEEIPKEIAYLTKLEQLHLTVNSIRRIPKEISALANLRILNLSDNAGLSDIDYVSSLSNLEELYLFGCNVHKMPENIEQLKNLKYLGLVGNQIDSTELYRIKRRFQAVKSVTSLSMLIAQGLTIDYRPTLIFQAEIMVLFFVNSKKG